MEDIFSGMFVVKVKLNEFMIRVLNFCVILTPFNNNFSKFPFFKSAIGNMKSPYLELVAPFGDQNKIIYGQLFRYLYFLCSFGDLGLYLHSIIQLASQTFHMK